jgi:benzoyl-CoA reductase subunit D
LITITAGIDSGCQSTKAVVISSGRIIGKGKVLTSPDPAQAVHSSLEKALGDAGISRKEVSRIAWIGPGSDLGRIADMAVDGIKAMARGALFFFPTVRTVADVGAEDGRAARIDARRNVLDFVVNEKCAAGAGAFIEVMARALEVSVEEMGALCLQSTKDIPINAHCVIFAESEAVGLIHANTKKTDISKAVHDAMAARIVSMIRRVGMTPDVALIGGVARNPGIVSALKRGLGLDRLLVPDEPEYGAAVGAAMLAVEEAEGT